MAHPTQAFPRGFYVIDEVQTATADFYAVTCEAAGDINVTGGGRFEYVDIDAASASDVVKYIDPSTGQPYVNEAAASGDAAGFYEKIPSEVSVITLAAGQTVYGAFTSVKATSGEMLAYYK
jgi:hypothetical protein